MRIPILILAALVALLLAGCMSAGPGAACDECAIAEADAAPGGAAAAASAKGGMSAENAPFSGEAGFAPRTHSVVGRGAGDSSMSTADTTTRETASGGAQNTSVMGNPTDARAAAQSGGGGVSVSVQEARKDLATWRSALALEMTKADPDMAKLDFFRSSLQAARADLNAAEAAQASSRPNVTINNNQNGSPTLIAVSTSKTGKQPGIEEKPAQALSDAAAKVATTRAPAAPEPLPPLPGGSPADDGEGE